MNIPTEAEEGKTENSESYKRDSLVDGQLYFSLP